MGGEGQEHLRRRQGVAVRVVRPVHGQAEGPGQVGQPGRPAELLREHGSLEGVIEAAIRIQRPALRKSLIESAGALRDYREIATLQRADVELPADSTTDWAAASEAAKEFGMNRLAERLAAKAG